MKNKILALFAVLTLAACGVKEDLSSAWSNISDFSSTSEALTNYTSLIEKHSQESWANKSPQIVDTCQIKPEGMTEDHLIEMIHENQDQAQACWDMLVAYPKSDVRFFKEGSLEQQVLAKFNEEKDNLTALFKN